MNHLVERWFSALNTKNLQRSAHRSVKELTADIPAWVANWNETPPRSSGTGPADEILHRSRQLLVHLADALWARMLV
jgi:hypothetical protein